MHDQDTPRLTDTQVADLTEVLETVRSIASDLDGRDKRDLTVAADHIADVLS